jgi:phage terminase large subunit-like protein
LIDVWRDRVEFPALIKKVLELRTSFDADLVLVEDAGSGTSLIQTLNERTAGSVRSKPPVTKSPG